MYGVRILYCEIEDFKIQKDNCFLRLPGVEPGSIAWKAIILTVGLQTLDVCIDIFY